MEAKLQEYQAFMEETAVHIIPITNTIGLISALPLPFDINPTHFIEVCTGAMSRAKDLNLEYIVVDISRMSGVKMVHNIVPFSKVIEAFRVIGIEVVLSGISPKVALEVIKSGTDNFKDVQTFGTLRQALETLGIC